MKDAVTRVLKENLGAKKGERLLVLGDSINPQVEIVTQGREVERREATTALVPLFVEAGKELGLEVSHLIYPALGAHGKEPPLRAWELALGKETVEELDGKGLLQGLLKKDHRAFHAALPVVLNRKENVVDAVVAIPHYSTSHTSFRKLITESGGRYASMPLFDTAMLTSSLAVDTNTMRPLTERIALLLTEAHQAVITSKDGTELFLSLKGRRGVADTGDLTAPGSFGNLPAGEAFVAPVEGSAQGRYITLWGPTNRLSRPTTFVVEKGMVERVDGDPELCRYLEGVFQEHPQARNVAELGIGTNPRASRPDNILEAEKILGTVHLAFGDNSTFGGQVKVPFHQDFVLFNPTLILKGEGWEKAVLREGAIEIG